MTYLSYDEFRDQTVMPSTFVDELELDEEGWVEKQLESWSRWIDARLRKQYTVPLAETPNAPESVKEWLARIVTMRCYIKRGIDPNDLQIVEIRDDSIAAKAEVLEAANSENGWFDLPTLESADPSAISKGGPFGYSEASPYVWMDEQAQTGKNEDQSGRGS